MKLKKIKRINRSKNQTKSDFSKPKHCIHIKTKIMTNTYKGVWLLSVVILVVTFIIYLRCLLSFYITYDSYINYGYFTNGLTTNNYNSALVSYNNVTYAFIAIAIFTYITWLIIGVFLYTAIKKLVEQDKYYNEKQLIEKTIIGIMVPVISLLVAINVNNQINKTHPKDDWIKTINENQFNEWKKVINKSIDNNNINNLNALTIQAIKSDGYQYLQNENQPKVNIQPMKVGIQNKPYFRNKNK